MKRVITPRLAAGHRARYGGVGSDERVGIATDATGMVKRQYGKQR